MRKHLEQQTFIEHDAAYWLEHVGHWGILLIVSVSAVAVFAQLL